MYTLASAVTNPFAAIMRAVSVVRMKSEVKVAVVQKANQNYWSRAE